MKTLFIALTLTFIAGSFCFAQDAETKTKPEKVTVTGTIKKNPESGNITLYSADKKRYFIIKSLHEKVNAHLGKKVTITGGTRPGKKAGTTMFVYIGKIAPATGGGKGKGKGKGKAE